MTPTCCQNASSMSSRTIRPTARRSSSARRAASSPARSRKCKTPRIDSPHGPDKPAVPRPSDYQRFLLRVHPGDKRSLHMRRGQRPRFNVPPVQSPFASRGIVVAAERNPSVLAPQRPHPFRSRQTALAKEVGARLPHSSHRGSLMVPTSAYSPFSGTSTSNSIVSDLRSKRINPRRLPGNS